MAIKLKEWCGKNSIAYITAYRWFKAGKFPGAAYQTETGTILVEDDNIENESEAASHFIKKTVEFSNNSTSIEDFAAFVLSNYKLEMREGQKKSKPTPEQTSKHFQKFLSKPATKPQPNMFMLDLDSIDKIISTQDPDLDNLNIPERNINPLDVSLPGQDLIAEMQSQLGLNSAITGTYNSSSASILSNVEPFNFNSSVISASSATDFSLKTAATIMPSTFNQTYDVARKLVDQMIEAKLLQELDVLKKDQKAKEMCSWPKNTFENVSAAILELIKDHK